MSTRSSARDVWVGLIVIVAVAGLLALVGHGERRSRLPGAAPHDRRGLPRRPGHPHRQHGAGRRPRYRATWSTSTWWRSRACSARGCKISLPAALVKKLRQDVKVSIQPALTGMSHVNVLSTGRSSVALVPGQSIPGVETSFFDPIIEQVGLGPVERNHLSHTIAEVRQTGRFDRAADPADARVASGNDQQPARDERLDPAGRRIDRRACRGHDPQAQRQLAAARERSSSTSRA